LVISNFIIEIQVSSIFVSEFIAGGGDSVQVVGLLNLLIIIIVNMQFVDAFLNSLGLLWLLNRCLNNGWLLGHTRFDKVWMQECLFWFDSEEWILR